MQRADLLGLSNNVTVERLGVDQTDYLGFVQEIDVQDLERGEAGQVQVDRVTGCLLH